MFFVLFEILMIKFYKKIILLLTIWGGSIEVKKFEIHWNKVIYK